MLSTPFGRVLALLFMLLSGFAALTYEVCWERMLHIGLGLDVYSSTAAATGFLLGLGVGAYFVSRLADAPRNPLRIYAWLEIGIGLLGFLSPVMLRCAVPLMAGIDTVVGDVLWLALPAKLLCSTLVVGVPCVLMGATLPVLVRSCITSSDDVGSRTGWLYGPTRLEQCSASSSPASS